MSDVCDCDATLPASAAARPSTVLAAPLVNGGRLVGVVQAGSLQAGHFNQRHLVLLQDIADTAARAIGYAFARE